MNYPIPNSQFPYSERREMDKRDKGGAGATSSPMELGGSRDIDEGNTSMRTGETMLRLMPVVLCMVALVVMLKNSETNDFGSLAYSDLGAFRYLVHANGICAGYSLLSAIFTAIPRPFTMPRAWTFFFLDQVLTYVILVAGVASTDVLYLAYKGDTSVTWSEACGTYEGFCKKAVASVAMTSVTVTCYAAISVLSSYKLFSKFDAPVNYRDKGIEIPVFQG